MSESIYNAEGLEMALTRDGFDPTDVQAAIGAYADTGQPAPPDDPERVFTRADLDILRERLRGGD